MVRETYPVLDETRENLGLLKFKISSKTSGIKQEFVTYKVDIDRQT
jgi:hypothetical protein